MSVDPVQHLAMLRIIKLSADLEAQLRGITNGAPALEILKLLRIRAAESLAALPFLNVFDEADRVKMVTCQNEVKRYDEWVGWLREIIAKGIAADAEITAEEREEMLDLLTQTADGERQAIELGLIEPAPQDA